MRGGKGRRIDGTRGRERPCAYVRRGREGDGADARGDIPMAGESGAWAAVGEGGGGEAGGKKGVKNVGAEETGGKNRAVSTEAAGVCRERDEREEDRTAREEGVKREEPRWVVDERKEDGRRA